jgi:large subunit ribosomal protein L23
MEDSPYKIVKRILYTEKGNFLKPQNKYIFEVDRTANKIEIRQAVEKIYQVKVDKVNTIKKPRKPRRLRYFQEGKTSLRKKAIVTLKQGYEIEQT